MRVVVDRKYFKGWSEADLCLAFPGLRVTLGDLREAKRAVCFVRSNHVSGVINIDRPYDVEGRWRTLPPTLHSIGTSSRALA